MVTSLESWELFHKSAASFFSFLLCFLFCCCKKKYCLAYESEKERKGDVRVFNAHPFPICHIFLLFFPMLFVTFCLHFVFFQCKSIHGERDGGMLLGIQPMTHLVNPFYPFLSTLTWFQACSSWAAQIFRAWLEFFIMCCFYPTSSIVISVTI